MNTPHRLVHTGEGRESVSSPTGAHGNGWLKLDSYLASIQVMGDLQDQEEHSERLLLDGVSLPVLDNLPTQSQKRVHLLELPLHEKQLQEKKGGEEGDRGEKHTTQTSISCLHPVTLSTLPLCSLPFLLLHTPWPAGQNPLMGGKVFPVPSPQFGSRKQSK